MTCGKCEAAVSRFEVPQIKKHIAFNSMYRVQGSGECRGEGLQCRSGKAESVGDFFFSCRNCKRSSGTNWKNCRYGDVCSDCSANATQFLGQPMVLEERERKESEKKGKI